MDSENILDIKRMKMNENHTESGENLINAQDDTAYTPGIWRIVSSWRSSSSTWPGNVPHESEEMKVEEDPVSTVPFVHPEFYLGKDRT